MKAYPLVYKDQYSGEQKIEQGMDLRDYFAAKAMQTMLRSTTSYSGIAKLAYQMADEMLKAR